MLSATTAHRVAPKSAHLSFPSRLLHVGTTTSKHIRGGHSVKKYRDPILTAPSSLHPEFNPKRDLNFPIDPKSNPGDCAPYQDISGEHSRSGMRSAEYSCVDKKDEPYSPPGGEHRYGGTRRYEWNVRDLGVESTDKGKKL